MAAGGRFSDYFYTPHVINIVNESEDIFRISYQDIESLCWKFHNRRDLLPDLTKFIKDLRISVDKHLFLVMQNFNNYERCYKDELLREMVTFTHIKDQIRKASKLMMVVFILRQGGRLPEYHPLVQNLLAELAYLNQILYKDYELWQTMLTLEAQNNPF